MAPAEKLSVYGLAKLRILAKRYQIGKYSVLRKAELIEELRSHVKETDFPIRA